MSTKPTLWLRAEHKPLEARVAVTPVIAKQLVSAGFPVVIEESSQRAFDIQDYIDAGCSVAAEHSWRHSAANNIIIGLKELPDDFGALTQTHIHFAHVYKYQQGWQSTLNAFHRDGGRLYDLEYLVDEDGRRVAAFGYWAGFVGAALSILAWCAQRNNTQLGTVEPWHSQIALVDTVKSALNSIGSNPSILVIGALGRSGRGAIALCESYGLSVTSWDQQETAAGGPFDQILQHHILINCVFLNSPVGAFTTLSHMQNPTRSLSVIGDVSCDPYSELNPLPVYTQCTTMLAPTERVIESTDTTPLPVDVMSIDHLPSLLPVESSQEFSNALAPHLLQLDSLNTGVWKKAADMFDQKIIEAQGGNRV